MGDYWDQKDTGKKISVSDVKKYKKIGDGKDGRVYQLSFDRCVKIFYREDTHRKELEAIRMGQFSSIIPRLYGYGRNYIVMEYVDGLSLSDYLKKYKTLPESLVESILYMLDELEEVGFARRDTEVRHILINKRGELKVIDHKRALTSHREIPEKLFEGLKKRGYLKKFLQQVKYIRPSLYNKWKDEY
ncbi:MAG TPA: AarF/UbiB family protein [Chondromyces sp.]|nr:AarF/UbiB family protein [Chondromyces sp.]